VRSPGSPPRIAFVRRMLSGPLPQATPGVVVASADSSSWGQ
jgi:hypothetical protein